jgi:tRNA-dihydrouridine synthase
LENPHSSSKIYHLILSLAETSGVGFRFLNIISLLRESMDIPVVANGDVRSLDDVSRVTAATGCHGVMAAR